MKQTKNIINAQVFVKGYFRQGKWIQPSSRSSPNAILDKYGKPKTKP